MLDTPTQSVLHNHTPQLTARFEELAKRTIGSQDLVRRRSNGGTDESLTAATCHEGANTHQTLERS
jgi:hypothetical protein